MFEKLWVKFCLFIDAIGDMFMDEGNRTSWMRVTCFIVVVWGLYNKDLPTVIAGLSGKSLQNLTELKSS